MAYRARDFLKDKRALYIVGLITLMNLIGYVMMHNTQAVLFFFIIGILTAHFNKNMIVVMLSAMIFTNLLVSLKPNILTREGFKEGAVGRQKKNDVKSKDDEEKTTNEDTDNEDTINKNTVNKNTVKDTTAPTTAASDSSVKGLLDQQQKLVKKLEAMEPMMNMSNKLIEGMGGVEGLQNLMASVSGLASVGK